MQRNIVKIKGQNFTGIYPRYILPKKKTDASKHTILLCLYFKLENEVLYLGFTNYNVAEKVWLPTENQNATLNNFEEYYTYMYYTYAAGMASFQDLCNV